MLLVNLLLRIQGRCTILRLRRNEIRGAHSQTNLTCHFVVRVPEGPRNGFEPKSDVLTNKPMSDVSDTEHHVKFTPDGAAGPGPGRLPATANLRLVI